MEGVGNASASRAQLEGLLNGSDPALQKEIDVTVDGKPAKQHNSEYAKWVARDQQVVSNLLASISKEVLTQVVNKTTAFKVWSGIREMLSS